MRLPRTPEFDAERERYAFAFTCEDCAHFERAEPARCRHEYPTEPHRDAYYCGPAARELVFCKEFELR